MKHLITKNVGIWDADKELYRSDIGWNDKNMTLYASAWGNTEQQAINRATDLCRLLNERLQEFDNVIKN